MQTSFDYRAFFATPGPKRSPEPSPHPHAGQVKLRHNDYEGVKGILPGAKATDLSEWAQAALKPSNATPFSGAELLGRFQAQREAERQDIEREAQLRVYNLATFARM